MYNHVTGRCAMSSEQRGRLQKSSADRVLFGVAGGLAEYLNVDPVLIRAGFVDSAVMLRQSSSEGMRSIAPSGAETALRILCHFRLPLVATGYLLTV